MSRNNAITPVARPVRAVVEISVVVEVTEAREKIDSGVADALLETFDPADLIEMVPGVEVTSSTCQVQVQAEPDFARMFPLPDEPGGDRPRAGLTPRGAALLHAAGEILTDEASDDLRHHGDAPVTDDGGWSFFDQLPRMTWKQDAVWRLQMVRALDDLVTDLGAGREPYPRCVGEAVALEQILTAAEGLAPIATDTLGPTAMALPRDVRDEDWEGLRETLFEDRDFDLLSNPSLDGIENDEELRQALGMDLRAHLWFRPYPWAPPRDPLRGFPPLRQ